MSPDTDAPTDEATPEDEASPAASDTDAAPEAPSDPEREAVRDRLVAELGDAVVGSYISPGFELWVRVTPEAWRTAGFVLRDDLGCRWFDFLSAIDWMPSPFGRYENDGFEPPVPPDPSPDAGSFETGYSGGDSRFQVFARVVNQVARTSVVLKADLPDSMAIESWVTVYDGADWHEREAWEMFGITFVGHPGLRHLYLPGAFEGYPLRKDFPLIARIVKPWPGIVDVEPMPAEDEEEGAGEGESESESESDSSEGGEAG